MKLLDRYLFSSIIKSSILVLLGLVLLFSFFQFLEELNDVDKKDYSISIALNYIALLLPSFFNLLLILGLMIGVVFSLGQLNTNKELQIFQVASISKKNIVYKSIKYTFFISVVLIIVLEIISPFTSKLADQIKRQAQGKPLISQSGAIWLKINDKFVFYEKKKRKKKNTSIKVFDIENKTSLKSILFAKNINFSDENISLKNPKKVEIHSDGDFYLIRKKHKDKLYRLELEPSQLEFLNKSVKEMSIFEMIISIKNSINFRTTNQELTELISRVIKPFTLIGMILIAIPFVLNTQRTASVGNRIFISISIAVFAHLITKITSIVLVTKSSTSFVGPFIPTLTLLLIGVLVLRVKKQEIY